MPSIDRTAEALGWFETGLKTGRLGHSYIITGPTRTLGMQFALKALSRLFDGDGTHQADPANHPDVMWVEPVKKSRAIAVADIRKVTARMAQTSFAGGWKACVILDADRLNVQASNAFLKTLEEPPGKGMFFLLTAHPEALLPTISSRCQRITLSGETVSLRDEWRTQVRDIMVLSKVRGFIGGQGMAADFQELLGQIKSVIGDEVEADTDEELDSDALEARIISKYRETRASVLHLLMLWHRDILMSTCSVGRDSLYFRGCSSHIIAAAEGLSYARAASNVSAVEAMNRQLNAHLDERTVFSQGFARLAMR